MNEDQETPKSGGGVAAMSGAIAKDPRGRFAPGVGLSDKQRKFIACFVANGGNATAAARGADYSSPHSDGWRLMQNPAIVAEIDRRNEAALGGLAVLALRTLGTVLADETAPAAARVKAATYVLDAKGHGLQAKLGFTRLGIDATQKGAGDYSLAELEAMARAVEDRLRNITPEGERGGDSAPLDDEEGEGVIEA